MHRVISQDVGDYNSMFQDDMFVWCMQKTANERDYSCDGKKAGRKLVITPFLVFYLYIRLACFEILLDRKNLALTHLAHQNSGMLIFCCNYNLAQLSGRQPCHKNGRSHSLNRPKFPEALRMTCAKNKNTTSANNARQIFLAHVQKIFLLTLQISLEKFCAKFGQPLKKNSNNIFWDKDCGQQRV